MLRAGWCAWRQSAEHAARASAAHDLFVDLPLVRHGARIQRKFFEEDLMRKFALSLVATFALAVGIPGSSASPAAAYGNDAIYQIEFSLNCTDRNSTFCTQVVGLGGLWGWIAVGNDGFADVEATFCGHGFPLAPYGGADHLSADIPWSYTSTQGEF